VDLTAVDSQVVSDERAHCAKFIGSAISTCANVTTRGSRVLSRASAPRVSVSGYMSERPLTRAEDARRGRS